MKDEDRLRIPWGFLGVLLLCGVVFGGAWVLFPAVFDKLAKFLGPIGFFVLLLALLRDLGFLPKRIDFLFLLLALLRGLGILPKRKCP